MRLIRNPQLWLALVKELLERNRGLNLNQIAASLAFTTTLALVPMLTIATILIGYLPSVIQVKNAFRSWLLDTYMPGGINQQVFIYLDQFSSKARGLTYVGLIGLVITTIMTLSVIEGAFNQIFKVEKNRPLLKKIIIYSCATFLGPVLLGLGIYLSGILFSASEGWIAAVSFGFRFTATVAPIFLAVGVYAVVYKILPYSNVLWSDAFVGALIAALSFEIMKFGYAIFLTHTAFYKTVYGAFAIFPLGLLWIYMTWWITLAGAILVANLPGIRSGVIRVIRY
ncbi:MULTISPECIES: YhjD/YihY/BrkB family envelope integrity protein [unclassified Polynucleobacter]|jgi:membrane protein|uniref:YhjD/YihY/BrkB family envelope integrity protein n=1 Tax=unclassified Polynucleobacter TaxID=2640945 RepID=UPI001BFEE6F9|nr:MULTISPECIES: YhjD/YihY/BrkB family envelope integrity protein [unclassified Polynucleobacter]MBU3606711.1 YihY family inner membrane protein [Polynucleobacter sp. MWH-Creno-3A4]QWD77214.1 YihY family inner membrane protein [Polynucleobacter sp. MWH-Svant-W18]